MYEDQTQTEDLNDAAWNQRQMEEQRMLSEDPGYFAFLKTYEDQDK